MVVVVVVVVVVVGAAAAAAVVVVVVVGEQWVLNGSAISEQAWQTTTEVTLNVGPSKNIKQNVPW